MARTSYRRSDEIRLRRSKRVQKPIRNHSRGRKNEHTSRTSPPVLARYPMVTSDQINEKRPKRTRMRFDLPLNEHGLEMRLPAIPKIRFGWRPVSFIVGIMLAYILNSYWNSPEYQVETVEIKGLHQLDSSVVSSYVDAEGQQIFMVDPMGKEQELIDAFPEFTEVDIQVFLPNTVIVTVTERVPVLIWRQDGRSNLVDMEGMTFPMRDESHMSSLPVVEAKSAPPSPLITSFSTQNVAPRNDEDDGSDLELNIKQEAVPIMTQEMVSAILALVEIVPEGASLMYETHHGLGWNDPRGWVVYFGEFASMQAKLNVYEAILQHLIKQDTRPTLISVEFLHAPYYRLTE